MAWSVPGCVGGLEVVVGEGADEAGVYGALDATLRDGLCVVAVCAEEGVGLESVAGFL